MHTCVLITCALHRQMSSFGTHVTCQVATGLKDNFKVFITTNNTHHFRFQFYVFLDLSRERERDKRAVGKGLTFIVRIREIE
jgi:hypothetical protein